MMMELTSSGGGEPKTLAAAEKGHWLSLSLSHERLRNAWILLITSLLLIATGLWMQQLNRRHAVGPAKLAAAQASLEKMGNEEGLERRRTRLLELRDELRLTRQAMASDVLAYSGRIEDVFAHSALTVTAASDWQQAPELARGEAAIFKRLYQGRGPARGLWTALHSFESWPDRTRVRALEVTPKDAGTISFALEIAMPRLPLSKELAAAESTPSPAS